MADAAREPRSAETPGERFERVVKSVMDRQRKAKARQESRVREMGEMAVTDSQRSPGTHA